MAKNNGITDFFLAGRRTNESRRCGEENRETQPGKTDLLTIEQ